ncbi:MAG: PAS domain-containing sensor histidine kinase [Candidatus Scalindua sp. AMX11]|nr:MAG: PAS domain-containing sensor histidine kinase [Candidatus Scalindua sp.]NOG83074.1 PAS domain S-box protein [Planctomycetota bacterium]RZV79531.1 MAG: PAS domain-containing sensor histidine kinase [Candidatus Scalindua sp. SCAELEC01]TDE65167.1 MAG: PAS domain-containing sensor histidine kinase [Candidatus Scalindua sp. AMX11]GJQ58597.1 MAG: hypothetical protein SCALA701_13980 [Candidatus Scalindua sp.]
MKKRTSQQEQESELRKRAETRLKSQVQVSEEMSNSDMKKLIHELKVHQVELQMQNDELLKTQMKLEESRERYANLYDFAPVGYFTMNEKGLILEANLTGALLLGTERRYLINKPISKFITKEDQDIYYMYLRDIGKKRDRQTCELHMLKRDKTHFYAQFDSIVVKDSVGNFNKHRVIISDISKRKLAEDLLRESEEKYRDLLDNANDLFQSVKPDGVFIYVNRKWKETLGYSDEEVVHLTLFDILHPDSPSNCIEALRRVMKGEKVDRIEVIFLTKGGRMINVEGSISCIFQEGKPVAIRGIFRDITERKQMAETLLQSEKLKALGVISSGIAHEFNNILAIVKGYSQLLAWESSDNRELTDGLRSITQAADDGAKIVHRIREFTKVVSDDLWFENVDINELIEQTIDFLRPRWKAKAQSKGITYRINTKDLNKVTAVKGIPVELREVLVNIINNALDAMPAGGTISFRTRRDGDMVWVNISDTGTGMTREVLKMIFDPFFTTRMPEGTGLGMSVAYGTIKRHGGKIEVKSELGKGSTITLSLPSTRKTIHSLTLPQPTQQIKARNLRILVVDDEQYICKILNTFLSDEGQNVRCVDNGSEAIKLLKSESFDLVLCDLIMPEVSGYDVIKALKTLDKRPKVFLITGWNDKLEITISDELNVDSIIKKPFNFSELSGYINSEFHSG